MSMGKQPHVDDLWRTVRDLGVCEYDRQSLPGQMYPHNEDLNIWYGSQVYEDIQLLLDSDLTRSQIDMLTKLLRDVAAATKCASN